MKTSQRVLLGLLSLHVGLAPMLAEAQNKQSTGAVLGGILGGLIANSSSSAQNRDFNTIIGILGGAFLGSAIGRDLDRRDQEAMAAAKQRSLEKNRMEQWEGSSSGASGSIRATQTGFHRRTREMCRRYESKVSTRNGTEVFRGVSCLSQDGTWKEVPESDVSFDTHSSGQGDLPGSSAGGVIPSQNDRNQRSQQNTVTRQGVTTELEITRITRRSGGEYFAITFDRAVQLEQIQIQVLDGQAKIHNVAFVTESGFRFQARQLSNSGHIFTGRILSSENLRGAGRVKGIEIQAESMNSLADIRVRIVGTQQAPETYLGYGRL